MGLPHDPNCEECKRRRPIVKAAVKGYVDHLQSAHFDRVAGWALMHPGERKEVEHVAAMFDE
jgi:hypothetical protein